MTRGFIKHQQAFPAFMQLQNTHTNSITRSPLPSPNPFGDNDMKVAFGGCLWVAGIGNFYVNSLSDPGVYPEEPLEGRNAEAIERWRTYVYLKVLMSLFDGPRFPSYQCTCRTNVFYRKYICIISSTIPQVRISYARIASSVQPP